MAFYGGDELVKVEVEEFDAYCEQLVAAIRVAQNRLAEIRHAEGSTA